MADRLIYMYMKISIPHISMHCIFGLVSLVLCATNQNFSSWWFFFFMFELRKKRSFTLIIVHSQYVRMNADNFCIYPPIFFEKKIVLLKIRDSTVVDVMFNVYMVFFRKPSIVFSSALFESLLPIFQWFCFLCKKILLQRC